MNTKTTYQGFYASELNLKSYRGQDVVATAMNGNFHHGYTTMNYSNLNEGVEGANVVLDVVLKELVNHKQALEEGKRVDIHVEWTLTEDRTQHTSCLLKGFEVVEREQQ